MIDTSGPWSLTPRQFDARMRRHKKQMEARYTAAEAWLLAQGQEDPAVLRRFAILHSNHPTRGLQESLDLYHHTIDREAYWAAMEALPA